jgi:hypothetical protein
MTIVRPLALSVAVLTLLVPGPSPAQPTSSVDTFDLVLFGAGLTPSAQEIDLKTNPWRGDAWTPVSTTDNPVPCASSPTLRVVSGLPTDRYLGQDLRENYVALKLSTARDEADGQLRAAYALPPVDTIDAAACERFVTLIETNPSTVRRHSLAAHVRPRPAPLSADAPLIEHLEAPIRHRRPGVMEVEWLEILFAPE